MQSIGIIGGMSWHSTVEYYRIINLEVAAQRGGHHSAPLLISSLNFADIRAFQLEEDWDAAGHLLADTAVRLQNAGATAILIATNLMHKVAPMVEAAIDVPLLHIADAVGRTAKKHNATTVGLLGTQWTMQEDFYQERLAQHQIDVVVPDEAACEVLDTIIFDELTQGVIAPASREIYQAEIAKLKSRGAHAVVLGCTEISLLISAEDSVLPIIDSTECHAREATAVVLSR